MISNILVTYKGAEGLTYVCNIEFITVCAVTEFFHEPLTVCGHCVIRNQHPI